MEPTKAEVRFEAQHVFADITPERIKWEQNEILLWEK